MKYLFVLACQFISMALIFLVGPGSALAQTSEQVKMYLNPTSLNVQQGSTFPLPVLIDSNSLSINAVQSDITYPQNLLKVESIDTSSSAFPLQVLNQEENGNISIVRGSFSPVKGNNLTIAVINFKALSSGSATLTFLESSAAVNSPVDSLTSSPSLTLNITPLPTPQPTKTPNPSPKGSILKIYAAGIPALNVYPTIQLQLKNSQGQWVGIKSWGNIKGDPSSRKFMELVYNHQTQIMPGTIRLRFTNDYYDPAKNQDRNLVIDKINLDGTDYQSEAPATLSQGSWSPDTKCGQGFKKSEWLQCPGFFEYR